MSFIKSDSLLSNIKNASIRIDIRPTDGSNILQSILSNRGMKQREVKPQSIMDQDSGIFSLENNNQGGESLIEKLSSSKQNNQPLPTHHFNWIICKNQKRGQSQDDESQNNSNNQNYIIQKNHTQDSQINQNEKNKSIKMQWENNLGSLQHSLSFFDMFQRSNYQRINQPRLRDFCLNALNNQQNQYHPENNFYRSQIYHQQNKVQIQCKEQQGLKSYAQPEKQQKQHIKNETKNIPKNYGKAIICFIDKYRTKVEKITQRCKIDYNQLRSDLKKLKKSINTIADLRQLWSEYKYAKCMRIISIEFFRKHALSYIFDSRICTYGSHIKYRQRLTEAVSNPHDFKHIKDY